MEVPSDTENEDCTAKTQQENAMPTHDLFKHLKVKQERISLLENTVKDLNNRIGTEIIDDDCYEIGSSLALSRYDRNENVNTLHFQLDTEFGKKIYFITNVRIIVRIYFYQKCLKSKTPWKTLSVF